MYRVRKCFTSDDYNAEKTDKGFVCPICNKEVEIEYVPVWDGTKMPNPELKCKSCKTIWSILRT